MQGAWIRGAAMLLALSCAGAASAQTLGAAGPEKQKAGAKRLVLGSLAVEGAKAPLLELAVAACKDEDCPLELALPGGRQPVRLAWPAPAGAVQRTDAAHARLAWRFEQGRLDAAARLAVELVHPAPDRPALLVRLERGAEPVKRAYELVGLKDGAPASLWRHQDGEGAWTSEVLVLRAAAGEELRLVSFYEGFEQWHLEAVTAAGARALREIWLVTAALTDSDDDAHARQKAAGACLAEKGGWRVLPTAGMAGLPANKYVVGWIGTSAAEAEAVAATARDCDPPVPASVRHTKLRTDAGEGQPSRTGRMGEETGGGEAE